ncbi:Growth-regulating factor 1 [Tripterygium wilfordii]|uniref:Growth-regulating factor n=1 Tax=Tripterygium wilfordii TaxID=458696 RepID=A0A7J7DKA9_TRIWF|nr:growth-regulating factor 1-like [Tripterygium wilfordii]KAF5746748.1 Growth-regulating factor 1 [Tripterygium wilfordii]
MDFGVVGLDGLVGSDTTSSSFASLASDPETKHKWYGSGLSKQERSGTAIEDDWRSSKLVKTDQDFSSSKPQQQQMLSFSSPQTEAFSFGRTSQNATTLPYFQLTSSPAYNRNTGYSALGYNGANMHGVLAGVRGPFTPSQWMELEHQALIYKYITANVSVPSNLLIPIRKALESAGFSSFSGGLLRPNALGWGTFHLGFSNNTDPEPGRCRRTDGKKWRCSRDAVADQKYCERHINRGRHRSRKPVEGQTGHSVAATTNITKLTPTTASSSVVVGSNGSGTPNGLAVVSQLQLKNLQPGAPTLSAATPFNRTYPNKEKVGDQMQGNSGLSMLSAPVDLKSKENPFLISRQQTSYEGSQTEFGLVTSNSLLNPSNEGSSLMSCTSFGSSQALADKSSESQRSLHQFMDDWPKNQSDRSSITWPAFDVQSDRTQLSISIPMASDFTSSTSSPNNEKVTLSPLRLSREFDPIQMGLGVGTVLHEQNIRQANWIPISWESSMGGPLGEVLHHTSNSAADSKNSSALNLMTEGWDSSPRMGSSPTGVLQRTTFNSLSNSSAGSSPRTEINNKTERTNMSNDLIGSTVLHSMPAM